MKTSLASILFLSLFFFLTYEKTLETTLLFGEWHGESDSLIFDFKFMEDHSCQLIIKNKYSMSTSVITGNFVLDTTKSPIPLSINNIKELNNPIHTIMKFKSKDKLSIAKFSTTKRLRPVNFGENSILLTKVN